MARMRFGVFIAPHHPVGEHPTLQYERDLQLIEAFDRLGYDEVWVGEHHSGGWETIGHPEMFLAAAAQRTHRIKLATGVTSLPYHHPFNVAGRIAFLDHLSAGPGDPRHRARARCPPTPACSASTRSSIRDRQDEALEAIVPLLRSDEPVTAPRDWYDLQNGYLQVRPVQDDLEIVAAVSISPSGMRLAGKYGLSVISVASYSEEGLQALPTQWGWAETYAQEFGNDVSRDNWRVMMPFHIAEDRQTAFEEIYDGLLHWHNAYNVETLARPGRRARRRRQGLRPQDGRAGRRHRRHARRRGGGDRPPLRPGRRLRDAGRLHARLGAPAGDAAQLRPVRPLRDPPGPGPAAPGRALPADAGVEQHRRSWPAPARASSARSGPTTPRTRGRV